MKSEPAFRVTRRDSALSQVNAPGRQAQGFGEAAACEVKDGAEGAHLAGGFLGCLQEGVTLLAGQIKPAALVIVKLDVFVHSMKQYSSASVSKTSRGLLCRTRFLLP